jgi:hypothetical protein
MFKSAAICKFELYQLATFYGHEEILQLFGIILFPLQVEVNPAGKVVAVGD